MYRDTKNKILGGVLSGMARSLGIHPGILRAAFIICFFAIGGISLGISSGAMTLIYIILWIFLPAS
jgi:phage shock protein PspC (stress-responsive transcriptional regulator)